MGNAGEAGRGPSDTKSSQTAFVRSFDPEPYEVLKPLPVDVRPHRGEVQASFLPADLAATGPDAAAAVGKLKELILDVFDHLSARPPERLDAAGAAQLAVLREHIRKAAPPPAPPGP